MSRVVIDYRPASNAWSWRFEGSFPIVRLAGYVVRTQIQLVHRTMPVCKEAAMLVEYDETTRKFSCQVAEGLPMDELLGTLETMKSQLIDAELNEIFQRQVKMQAAIEAAKTPTLILPNDGKGPVVAEG